MRDKLKVALILLIIFLIWISPLLVVWLVTHLVFLYVFQAPERVSYYLSFMVAFVVTAFQNNAIDFISEREFVKAYFKKGTSEESEDD